MGPVGLPSRDTRTLAGLAVGLSGVGSSVLPRDGISQAVAADEKAYRSSTPRTTYITKPKKAISSIAHRQLFFLALVSCS
jgi:hypothetical protein